MMVMVMMEISETHLKSWDSSWNSVLNTLSSLPSIWWRQSRVITSSVMFMESTLIIHIPTICLSSLVRQLHLSGLPRRSREMPCHELLPQNRSSQSSTEPIWLNERSTWSSVFCRKFKSFGTIFGTSEPSRLWLMLSSFSERKFRWKSMGISVNLLWARFNLIMLSKVWGLPGQSWMLLWDRSMSDNLLFLRNSSFGKL